MPSLKNVTYVATIRTSGGAEEHYYRDKDGWVKESVRGNRFRATAEQVLNHLLPALAGLAPVTVEVKHYDGPNPKGFRP